MKLDQQRKQIQDDLRGLISGEVRCDDVFLQLYASDASIYEIKPLGIVRPRSTADVVACVQYAAEKQIPIHAQGAGSGWPASRWDRAWCSISPNLHRVKYVGAETVRVQPAWSTSGSTPTAAAGADLRPEPSNSPVTTIGHSSPSTGRGATGSNTARPGGTSSRSNACWATARL